MVPYALRHTMAHAGAARDQGPEAGGGPAGARGWDLGPEDLRVTCCRARIGRWPGAWGG